MIACLYCAPAVTPTKGSRSEQRIMAHVPYLAAAPGHAPGCAVFQGWSESWFVG
jgi:hypothetical protein